MSGGPIGCCAEQASGDKRRKGLNAIVRCITMGDVVLLHVISTITHSLN